MATEDAGLEISVTHLREGFTVEMADELRARMEAHPAKEASERWHLLARTLGAHAVNTDTLTRYLEEKERTAEWVLDDLLAHRMLAHLTNYLATAKMLVDHSRNMMKAYAGSDFAAEYERQKDELAGREDVQLVQGLRNYVLHQRSPAIGIHTVEDSFGRRSVILLDSAALLAEWSDIPAKVRRYLRTKSAIRILDEVRGYRVAIEEMYGGWLLPQYKVLHGEEIEDFNRIHAQLDEMSEVVYTFADDDGPTSFALNRRL